MSRVTYITELYHTYEWVVSHAYEWVMSHIWISTFSPMNESCTYDRVVSQSHMMSRVRMIESCHANKRVSCATWLTYKYDMAHSFVWQDWTLLFAWHDSILRTRLITWLCDTTRSYVHDSFRGEKGLIHTCDMTRSYVHDSSQDRVMSHESCVVSTYVTWVLCTYGRQSHVTWVVCGVNLCDMSVVYVWSTGSCHMSRCTLDHTYTTL